MPIQTKKSKKAVVIVKPAKVVKSKKTGPSAEDLQQQLAAAQKQLRIAQKKLSKKGNRSGVDVFKVAKEAAAEARKAALKEASKGSRKLQKQVETLLAENQQAKLKAIKAALMKRYGNQLITAMLVGKTKEELEAAAARAHKAWRGAVKGVGHPVEDDDDDETGDDEEDGDEEDADEEDLDTEEDEDEDQDADDEEDETPAPPKKKAPAPSHNRNRALPPVIPTARNKGTGLPRGDQRLLLKSVKAMTPQEFRESRLKVLAAAKQTWG